MNDTYIRAYEPYQHQIRLRNQLIKTIKEWGYIVDDDISSELTHLCIALKKREDSDEADIC